MPCVSGYVVRYGEWSDDGVDGMDAFRETFAPGAFREFLARRQSVPCLIDHQWSQRWGTADLYDDGRGLLFVVGRGLPPGCCGVSPQFAPLALSIYDGPRQVIRAADLIEVSLCVKRPGQYPGLFKYLLEHGR